MSELNKPYYKSKNSKQTKQRLNDLLNQKKYAYDASSDSVYSDYAGNVRANARTAATQAAAYGNRVNAGDTYSDRVSNQSMHRYTSRINEKVPELAEMDFNKYQANRQNDYNALNALAKKEQVEYGRYRDDMNQYWKEREFEYQKAKAAAAAARASAAAAAKGAKQPAEKAPKAATGRRGGGSGGGSYEPTPEPTQSVFPWEDPNQAASYNRRPTIAQEVKNQQNAMQQAIQERNNSYMDYLSLPKGMQNVNVASSAMLDNAEASVQAKADRLRELLKAPTSAGKQDIQKELNETEKKLDQYESMRSFREDQQRREEKKENAAYKDRYGVDKGSLKTTEDYDKAIKEKEEKLDSLTMSSVDDKWNKEIKNAPIPADKKEILYNQAAADVSEEKEKLKGQIASLSNARGFNEAEKKYNGMSLEDIKKSIGTDYDTKAIDGQISNIEKEMAMTPSGAKNDKLLAQKRELEQQKKDIDNQRHFAEQYYVDKRVESDMKKINADPELSSMMSNLDTIDENQMGTNIGNAAINATIKSLNEKGYEGKDIVDSYLRNKNAQLREQREKEVKDFADKYWGIPATAASFAYNSQSQLQGAFNVAYGALNEATGQYGYPVDYNAEENIKKGQIIRSEVGNNIVNAFGDSIPGKIAGKTLEMLYQGGASAIDSAISVGLYGDATTAMFALSAADDSYEESIEKGLPHDQAVKSAIASGVWEWLFETVELEGLKGFAELGAGSKREFIINMFKQAANEGVGEGLTDIFNGMSDQMINGYSSDFYNNVMSYMDAGMSYDEAKKKASIDFGLQVAESSAVGFISGFAMGGGATHVGNQVKQTVNDYKTGKTLDVAETVDEGLKAAPGSEAEAQAQKLRGKLDDDKKVSAIEVGKMKRLNDQYAKDQQVADAVAEVLGRSEAQEGISSAITTGKVTEQEAKAIVESAKARDVVRGTTGIELTEESSVKDVQKAVAEMAHADIDADRVFAAQNGFTRPMLDLVKEASKNEGRKIEGTAVQVNGTPGMITGIERKNGDIQIQVNTGNGIESVSIEDIQAEGKVGKDLLKMLDYAKNFRESGLKGFIAGYDGSISPDAYFKGYSDYYRAGQENYNNQKAFDDVRRPFGFVIPESVRATAFYNGMNDAKADLEARETRVAKARTEEAQRRSEGKKREASVNYNGHEGSFSESEKAAIESFKDLTNRNIVFEDMEDGKNAFIDGDGNIHINASSKNPFMYAAFHEYTHYCKKAAPTLYEDYKNTILNHMRKNDPAEYERLYNVYRRSYNKIGQKLTEDEIMEEIVCDATVAFVNDAESFRDAIAKDRTFGQKVSKFLNDMAEWLRDTFSGNKQHTASEYLAKNADLFEEAAQKWARMAEVAGVVDVSSDSRYSIKTNEYGVNYINIDIDQDMFDEFNLSEIKEMAQMYIQDYFSKGKTIGYKNGEKVYTTNSAAKKYARSHETERMQKDKRNAKYRVSTELDNLLKISSFISHEDDVNGHHPEAIGGFDYYLAVIKCGDRYYSGVINIMNEASGKKFFDFSKIKALENHGALNKSYLAKISKAYAISLHEEASKYKPKDKKRYSIEVDSDGRELSEQQQAYFADSKIRDDNGSLLTVYHGTPAGGFDVFRSDLTFFTADKKYAERYTGTSASSRKAGKTEGTPEVYEGYLNIKKPFDILNDKKAMKVFIDEYVKGGWALGINPYQSDSDIRKQVKDGISWEEADNLKEFFDEEGFDYDGIILNEGGDLTENGTVMRGISYVTFNPNQFKRSDNENPTDSDNMRFSIDVPVEEAGDLIAVHNLNEQKLLKTLKLGGFAMPSIAITKKDMSHSGFGDISVLFGRDTIDPKRKGNMVYSGDAWTPMFPTVEYKISEGEVKKVKQRLTDILGSEEEYRKLGIEGIDESNVRDYMNRSYGMYGRYRMDDKMMYAFLKDTGHDVSVPMKEKQIHYKYDNSVMKEIFDHYSPDEIRDIAMNSSETFRNNQEVVDYVKGVLEKYFDKKYKGKIAGSELLKNFGFADFDNIFNSLWQYSRNGATETVDTKALSELVSDKVDAEEYEKWINDLFSQVVEKEGFRNKKDLFTPSGNRRSYDQLHDEINLENAVRLMLSEKEKGSGAMFATNNIFGASTRQYKSLDDIRKDSERLSELSEEELNSYRSHYNDRLSEIADRMLNVHQRSDFMGLQGAKEAIADAVAASKTVSKLRTEMMKNRQWYHIDDDIIQDVIDLVSEIAAMPTKYFEAKPRRAVGFDEIETVVIPEGSSQELIDALDQNGIPYETYKEGDEEQRKNLLNAHTEARFSIDVDEDAYDPEYDLTGNEDTVDVDSIAQETMQLLDGYQITQTQIKAMYDKYVGKNHSGMSESEFNKVISNIAAYLNGNYRKNAGNIMNALQKLSGDTLSSAEEVSNPEWKKETQYIRDDLRKRQMVLSDKQLKEVISNFGSYGAFHKATFGKLNITTVENMRKKGLTDDQIRQKMIDNQWNELVSEYPEYFAADDVNQVETLVNVAQSIGQAPMVALDEKYGRGTVQEMARAMANDMFMDLMSAVNPVEANKKEQFNKLRTLYAERTQAYKELLNQRYQERYDELVKKQGVKNERILDAMARQKEAYRERELKRKESSERQLHKKNARKLYDKLNKMLEDPTDSMYIPKDMIGGIVDVLREINFDTGFRNPDGSVTKAYEKLDQIKRFYETLRPAEGTLMEKTGTEFDQRILDILENIKQMFAGDKNISQISNGDMEDLVKGLSYIYDSVRNSTTLIGKEENAKSYKYGMQTIEDVKKSQYKGKFRGLNALGTRYTDAILSPERFFRKLVAYNDNSPLVGLVKDLTRGEERVHKIKMDGEAIMKDVMDPKFLKEFTGSKAKKLDFGIVDQNGKKVFITPAMQVSIVMHSMNKSNLEHMQQGGLTIPDFDLYQQGKVAEAYAQGHQVRNITDQFIKALTEALTEDQKKFIAAAKKFFNSYSKSIVNDTSMKLNGYEKARVNNYFPIRTDSDFTKKPFDSIAYDFSLENSGFLKHRQQGARNPIMLEDVTQVIARQLNSVAQYGGLAVPLSNLNKVLNVSLVGYENSVMKEIGNRPGGSDVKKYIENMIADLNGARQRSTQDVVSQMLGMARSGLAGSVLTLNPSVTMKQAASYPTAAAVLGYGPLNKALAAAGRYLSPAQRRSKQDLIDKYTAEHWIRRQGSAAYGTDLETIGSQNNVLTKIKSVPVLGQIVNSIQEVDIGTTFLLWDAAEYYVQNHFDYTKGSDSYFRKVAEIYNKTIHDTQPNYSVMQRPEILRSTNELTKAFTMFMTQRLQNGNILFDSTANLKAKSEAYSANKTETNKKYLKQAQTEFAHAVTSQVLSACVLSAMTLTARALLHKMNPYRDDDKEITRASILEQLVKDALSSMAGSWLGGAELYDFVESKITGDKYYGINDNAIASISDLVDSFDKGIDNLQKVLDPEADEQTIIDNSKKILLDVAGAAGQILGVPVNNIVNIVNAVMQHVEDAQNDEFGTFKSGLKLTNKDRSRELYEAYMNGDEADLEEAYNAFIDAGKSPKQIDTEMKTKLFENDPRIMEAAKAKASGDYDTWEKLREEVRADGFNYDQINGAIKKAEDSLDEEEEEDITYDHLTSDKIDTDEHSGKMYDTEVLGHAVDQMDTQYIEKIRNDWIDSSEAKDPEKSVQTSINSAVKEAYMDKYTEAVRNGDVSRKNELEKFFNEVGVPEKTYLGWAKDEVKDAYMEKYEQAYKTGDTATVAKIQKEFDKVGINYDSIGKSDLKKEFVEKYHNPADRERLLSIAEKNGISEADMWKAVSNAGSEDLRSKSDACIKNFSDSNVQAFEKEMSKYIEDKKAAGKTEKEAKKAFNTAMMNHYRDIYRESSQDDRNRIENFLLKYNVTKQKTIRGWVK